MSNFTTGVVLILDDDPLVLSALGRMEMGPQFNVRLCSSLKDAEHVCATEEIEVALIDHNLAVGDPNGLEVLESIRARDPDCFRIIFTGAADLDFVVNAINQGLIDAFLVKPWTHETIVPLLNQGCETALLRRHNRQLAKELADRNTDLETFNLQLESLVEARTQDLRATLDRLKEQQQDLVRLETQATIAQLVRGLAHELNNPLASILGYAQRLRRKLVADTDTTNRLDVILTEVDRCCGLVDQLRNFAQPMAEKSMPCRLEEIVRQAAHHLTGLGKAPPACVIDGNLPRVLAAPCSLGSVFEHVLDNARLAGATACQVHAHERHGRVRIEIINDGETPDDLAVRDATKPFFTTRSSSGHRGLGLAIASSLLREQVGNIELARRADAKPGATVTITLPIVSGLNNNLTPLRVKTMNAKIGGGAVLVVDDEPLVAELLVDCLTEELVDAIHVSSVREALEIAQLRPLRAALVDYNLPDGSGMDLAQQLMRNQPDLQGHIAMITGAADIEVVQRLPKGLDMPILRKPFHLDDIHRLVRKIL